MRRGVVLCLALSLLALSGCGHGLPQAREMDNMALMRTMGVDQGEPSEPLLVTVSSSRRPRGVQGEEEPPLILSAQGGSMAGACQEIRGQSGSDVWFGHLDQLLLGESLARAGGAQTALEHFSRDPDLGLGTRVWLIRGNTAQAALQTQQSQGAQQRLTTLLRDSALGDAGLECTAGETLTTLLEGDCAVLPALTVAEGKQTLQEGGYGVFRDGALAFWLDGAAARGFELAQGHPGGALLELDQGVVRLNSAALTCVPVLDGTRLTGLELDLRVIAQVEQSRQETLDRDGIARAIQDQVGGWLRAALDQAQEERADFMGLARKAGAARPGLWRQMRAQWDETFPDLEITVRCTVGLTEIRK